MVEIFQLQLHKSSAVPLYQQLAEGIEGMITDGFLLANSKLPPIRKTAEHFGVNSVTIVNAYKLLEKKQLVYSRVGSGTFVSPLPVEHIPEPVASRNLRSFESGLSMENAINFTSTSLPNEMFPVDAFKEAFNAVLDREKGGAFRYMDSMGYAPLREQLCRALRPQLCTLRENLSILSVLCRSTRVVPELLRAVEMSGAPVHDLMKSGPCVLMLVNDSQYESSLRAAYAVSRDRND